MQTPEKTPLAPLSLRLTQEAKDKFVANVESRGWTVNDVMRRLVDSTNQLFEVTGGKPEHPLTVIDNDTVPIYLDPKSKAEMKRKLTETTLAQQAPLVAATGATRNIRAFVAAAKAAKAADDAPGGRAARTPQAKPRRPQGSPQK